MEKIYKGYELMWAVSKGLLNTTQKNSERSRRKRKINLDKC